MAAKKNQPNEAAIKPRNIIDVRKDINELPDDAVARTLTRPEVLAAITIQQWQGNVSEVNAIAKTLSLQFGDVTNGNMARPEAMLLAQAHTLDELFNNLARRARNQDQLKHYETFLRLALKAQGQCRSTLETLAAIKNPPVIFAKQANISNNQQINNGVPAPSQAGEIKNRQNELLVEAQYGSTTLDNETTSAAIGVDPAMATLAKSTGARTPGGKAISAQNAYKGGLRSLMKDVAMLLRDQKERLNRFI